MKGSILDKLGKVVLLKSLTELKREGILEKQPCVIREMYKYLGKKAMISVIYPRETKWECPTFRIKGCDYYWGFHVIEGRKYSMYDSLERFQKVKKYIAKVGRRK